MKGLTPMRGDAKLIALLIVLLIVLVAGYFVFSHNNNKVVEVNDEPPTQQRNNDDAVNPNVVAKVLEKSGDTRDCPIGDNWFPHSQTPRPDDAGFASSSNCEFHQWSWQSFLWLTQEVDGAPRFMSFESPESLIGLQQEGLLPRMTKGNAAESFDEFLQAGTDGILIAHNGRAVYYSQYIDDTFANFITSNGLTDPATVQSFIENDPTTPFPVGALELKASWMVVEEGDDVSGMFTTRTKIAKLINKDGGIVVDTSQTEEVTVALVGFHIAGVVNNHPEMIWATFEHERNAPNVYVSEKDKGEPIPLDQPVSNQNFTFYTKDTPLSGCNVNTSSSNRLVLDEATQTFSPITQVCRQYQYGNQPGVNHKNDQNIIDLNSHVAAKFGSDDVWRNYAEVGAIWFKGDNPKTLRPGLNLAQDTLLSGSLSLSNSTIETFTQVADAQNNCFRCHNTLQALPPKRGLDPLPASNLNISHAFQNIYFWSQEQTQANNPSASE